MGFVRVPNRQTGRLCVWHSMKPGRGRGGEKLNRTHTEEAGDEGRLEMGC